MLFFFSSRKIHPAFLLTDDIVYIPFIVFDIILCSYILQLFSTSSGIPLLLLPPLAPFNWWFAHILLSLPQLFAQQRDFAQEQAQLHADVSRRVEEILGKTQSASTHLQEMLTVQSQSFDSGKQ